MRGITLFSLFNLALKHIVVLILAAVIFAAGAFAYCEFVAVPRYSATGSVLITNGAVEKGTDIDENGEATRLENADVIASINFMDTASDMLRQNDIYKTLAREMDNNYSYNQLISMSEIKHREERSLYIDITFTASSKQEAVKLVNAYMSITPSYFKSQVNSVSVSYFEVDSASKVYPQTTMTTMMFAVLGAVIVYAVFLVIFLMNTTIVGEEDFKERFDVSVIGAIPDFASARSGKYNKYYNKYGYYGYYGYYGRGKKKNGN